MNSRLIKVDNFSHEFTSPSVRWRIVSYFMYYIYSYRVNIHFTFKELFITIVVLCESLWYNVLLPRNFSGSNMRFLFYIPYFVTPLQQISQAEKARFVIGRTAERPGWSDSVSSLLVCV